MVKKSKSSIFEKLLENRTIFLNQEIDAESGSQISASLLWLDSQAPGDEISLFLNCPGGMVQDGLFAIYDTMQYCTSPIKTICLGKAYSAAAVLLAAGTKGYRYAFPNAEVMIHSVQTDIAGYSQSQLELEIARSKKLNELMLKILSKHTGKSIVKIRKDTLEDKYFTAKEALEYGLIDGIITKAK